MSLNVEVNAALTPSAPAPAPAPAPAAPAAAAPAAGHDPEWGGQVPDLTSEEAAEMQQLREKFYARKQQREREKGDAPNVSNPLHITLTSRVYSALASRARCARFG
jgi:Spy/CpxP family protein refolding chaperone